MSGDPLTRRGAFGCIAGVAASSQMAPALVTAQKPYAGFNFFGTAQHGSEAGAIAAAEAITPIGGVFSTDDAAGHLIFRERTPEGSLEVARTVSSAMVSSPGAAEAVETRDGATLQESLDRQPWVARLVRSGAKCDFDFDTGSGSDDSAALQTLFDYADANRLQSVDLPGFEKNYLLGSTSLSVMQPGLLIRGDKGVSYNRGTMKNGNLVVGPAVDAALKIGGDGVGPEHSFENAADQWEVEHLGFTQAPGGEPKSKVGILFDRQTNGPDRGFILRGVSGQGLRALLEVAPKRDGVQTALANLVMLQCNASNNRWAIKANAPVFCLSARENQVEQNNNGLGPDGYDGGFIHGDIQGSVTVADNMMEGQPNAIDLAPSIGSIEASITGNYIEKNDVNSSRFVFRMGTAHTFLNNSALVARNFASGDDFPRDYLVINRKGNWHLTMEDRRPVTFQKWAGSLLRGSRLFAPGVRHFRLRGIDSAAKSPEIYLGDAYSHPDVSGGGLIGVSQLAGGSGYLDGDLVELRATSGEGGYGARAVVRSDGNAVAGIMVIEPGALYKPGEHLTLIGPRSSDATARADVAAYAWSQTVFAEGIRFPSPMGPVRARDATSATPLGFGCKAGDLIVVIVYVLVTDHAGGVLRCQLTTASGALVASLGESEAHNISQAQWSFICYPMIAPSAQPALGFRYATANGRTRVFVAGLSARNYGPYVNNGSASRDIFPVIPRL